MSENLIPCTVQVLTRNSMPDVVRCLASLRDFAEVIVLDGYSSDGTRETIGNFPNVRLIDQNRNDLDGEGRIIHFANVRNAGVAAATYPWILMVDADEYVTQDFVDEVRSVVHRNQPGVFEAFRRFYVDGEQVMHCAGYPALQIRLFHTSLILGFGKAVHERLVPKEGVPVERLRAEIAVPQPPLAELRPKYERYLQMEVARTDAMTWGRWFKWVLVRNIRSVLGLAVRLLGIWLLPKKGKRMPLAYELQYMGHLLRLIVRLNPLALSGGH